MKKNKTIKVYEESWPTIPEKPSEFIAFWESKIDLIPEEHKESASIEIESSPYYDSSVLEVTISYTREETDEEQKIREFEEMRSKEEVRAREIALLNQLKQKYEKS